MKPIRKEYTVARAADPDALTTLVNELKRDGWQRMGHVSWTEWTADQQTPAGKTFSQTLVRSVEAPA